MAIATIYGIRNCDTMRKARRWLDDHGVEYRFHDVRSDGLPRSVLQDWVNALGWENLLNRRGTTWRRLPESVRHTVNETAAIGSMLDNPAIIKRPMLEYHNTWYLGFSDASYRNIFRTTAA